MKRLISRLLSSAVVWSFLTSLVRTAGFFWVMGYALRKLPSADIGLWYVLLNLAGLISLVEMGFNTAISRSASYFMGGATDIPGLGGLQGTSSTGIPNYQGLAGLIRMARRLYRNFALLVGGVFLAGAGTWFLLIKPDYLQTPDQWIAFLIIAIGTAVNMGSLFWFPLLFGLNRVREYNQLQIGGLLVYYGFAFAGLRLGYGIPALAFGTILMNFIPRWTSRQWVLQMIPACSFEAPQPITVQQLWPITWRTGLASLAQYLMLGISTLICAQLFDLKTAASYGLCMQLALMLNGMACNWMVVKYPVLSRLRAEGQPREFNRIVLQRLGLCTITYLAGAVALVAIIDPILSWLQSNTLVLPRMQFSLLLLVVGLDMMINLHASIMVTSENSTPHLNRFITHGLLIAGLSFVAGRFYGITGLILTPLLVQVTSNYWWTPLTCWRILRAYK